MMTLKDIKVSKNHIPVQNALWLRPMGGLKFKVYYPQGGNWAEVNLAGISPEPTPTPTPEPTPDYEDMTQEIQELKDLINTFSGSLSTLSKKIAATEQVAKAGQINAYTAFINSEKHPNQIIIAPKVCNDASGSELPLYDTTEEILDSLYALAKAAPSPQISAVIKMYRPDPSAIGAMVLKTFAISYTESGSAWSTITLTEGAMVIGYSPEKFTITKVAGKDKIKNIPVNYYTIKLSKEASVGPLPGGGGTVAPIGG